MDADPARLPFGARPVVHVCMRDDANGPEDRLYACTIHDRHGDLVISLQADDIEDGVPASLQHTGQYADTDERWWLNLPGSLPGSDGAEGACFELRGLQHYVGNALWDAGVCDRRTAVALVRTLLGLGFHVEEVVCVD